MKTGIGSLVWQSLTLRHLRRHWDGRRSQKLAPVCRLVVTGSTEGAAACSTAPAAPPQRHRHWQRPTLAVVRGTLGISIPGQLHETRPLHAPGRRVTTQKLECGTATCTASWCRITTELLNSEYFIRINSLGKNGLHAGIGIQRISPSSSPLSPGRRLLAAYTSGGARPPNSPTSTSSNRAFRLRPDSLQARPGCIIDTTKGPSFSAAASRSAHISSFCCIDHAVNYVGFQDIFKTQKRSAIPPRRNITAALPQPNPSRRHPWQASSPSHGRRHRFALWAALDGAGQDEKVEPLCGH